MSSFFFETVMNKMQQNIQIIYWIVFLFIFLFLCCSVEGASVSVAAQNEAPVIRIEHGDTLRETLDHLLELTDQQVYLLDPVNLESGVIAMSDRPDAILRTLLNKYSYALTLAPPELASRVRVFSSPGIMPQDVLTPGENSNSKKKKIGKNALLSSKLRTESKQQRAGASTESFQTTDTDSFSSESNSTYKSETQSANDNLSTLELDELKGKLEFKIKQLENYIISGSAEEQYVYWSKIKDPKYIYDPWKELEKLKSRYSQL